ncbi:aldo/keto reductase [Lunatibacter salilacus]|uniref:aldo/keto reductase n=1 Tax=Lunatibacter salilacus TaxID=2483804 RepID=UPI001F4825DC|nr:aldo/keto reductase [Lunatibacter salilacus]
MTKKLTFANGDQMPAIGLGTWQSKPNEVYEAVLAAIQLGYRHFDCAHIYKNEKEIGEALQKAFAEGWVIREELWITSKLWNDSHAPADVLPALQLTLRNLQLEYLDLYLVHWPVSLKKGVDFPTKKENFISYTDSPLTSTWTAMEQLVGQGLTRHIGVSNFNTSKLAEILAVAKIRPEVNQVELHPFLQQETLTSFCEKNRIFLTAYGPLGAAYRVANEEVNHPILLENTTIRRIADKHKSTPAQIVLAWGMLGGIAVIPKSVNHQRIRENLESIHVALDEEDMEQISFLEGPYRYTSGPAWIKFDSPYKLSDLWEEFNV